MAEQMPTRAEITALVSYNPWTGKFRRQVKTRGGNAGSIAGCDMPIGYRNIGIKGQRLLEHRVAWFLCHQEWPLHDIDHINGVRNDNRIDNLRLATRRENCRNSKIPSTNRSGFKGVYWSAHANRWRASICVNRKQKNLGYFDDPELAHAKYCSTAKTIFG